MKKILALSIATLSIVTLAACSGQKSDSDMKKTDDSSMMKNFFHDFSPLIIQD